MVQLGDGPLSLRLQRPASGSRRRWNSPTCSPSTGATRRPARSSEDTLDVLNDPPFLTDFRRLYNVYEKTAFRKFAVLDGKLYMKFGTGPAADRLRRLQVGIQRRQSPLPGRSRGGRVPAHRVSPRPRVPLAQTPDRESYRYGDHPHVSIEDRVFVECVGGDLTIKVEDNTSTGEGIYAEPVDDQHQKVDDAEIEYAVIDHLIVLKIRPYKERDRRYFIFNEKQHSVERVDSIGQSCVLLPEGHGLIFPDGYYLATGELKRFEMPHRQHAHRARHPRAQRRGRALCVLQPHDGRLRAHALPADRSSGSRNASAAMASRCFPTAICCCSAPIPSRRSTT